MAGHGEKDNGIDDHAPRQTEIPRRVIYGLIGAVLTPLCVFAIWGVIDYHDVGFAYLIAFAMHLTLFYVFALSAAVFLLRKIKVRVAVHYIFAGGASLGLAYLIMAFSGDAVLSVLNVLLFLAMGGVSGLVFWAIGVRKSGLQTGF